MEELIRILEEIEPDTDYSTCKTLIDDHILDSFAILSLVSEIEDTFDVQISAAEMTPENFNSADAIFSMIKRLEEEC